MKLRLFTFPNILTLCNLLSGCAAVIFALCINDLELAFWCVLVAAVFDFLDGFFARLLEISSPVGKELDSLADMISFGLAPASILYSIYVATGGDELSGFVVFILVAFSALRLAKFNLDERQTSEFIGLPTPASNCGLIRHTTSPPLFNRFLTGSRTFVSDIKDTSILAKSRTSSISSGVT